MTEIIRCVLLLTFMVNSTYESKMDMFIIGGGEATINEYPHSVFFLSNCSEYSICGGAVLNQDLVLTAAHCVFGCEIAEKGHQIYIYLGESHLMKAPALGMKDVKSVLVFMLLLQRTTCTRKTMEGFIVGGHQAPIKVYPHSVFLSMFCKSDWICGGAILNQVLIVTAAHCVHHCSIKKGHRLEVRAGTSDLNQVQIKRNMKRFIAHQRYNENTVHNDIAIALMDRAIPFGVNVKRVIIPKRFPPEAAFARVAGWGTIDEDTGATSMTLKQVEQKLRSVETCKKLGDLPISMFCAGSTNYYEDRPAQGDSGSALITDDYAEIGLVSFRIPPYPALMVYTNVSYYHGWVSRQAKLIFCESKK